MAKKASPTAIGAFVVGATVLAITVISIFGSGRLFRDIEQYVLYFDGSVQGLNVGAPVMFRGVRIGSVTDIVATFDPEDRDELIRIGVYIEVLPDRIRETVSISGSAEHGSISFSRP